MACNTCIQNNDCGCNNPCPPEPCACPVLLSSDCINNVTEDLECSGIEKGQTLTEVLVQLDAFICEKFNQTVAYFNLLNVGTGAEVYKGVNGVGNKLIRKINKVGNLITVTQNTDDISLSIDETALGTFIENNQLTYTVSNLGTDPSRVKIYKDSTTVGNNTQFNFRSVVKQDLGNGVSFLRDIQENTNELNVRIRTLVSDNLTITSTDDEVRIETPVTASIPALYVNSLYTPSYSEWLAENKIQNGGTALAGFVFRGKGTLAQPFTDSVVYPLAGGLPTTTINTAIQNALDGDNLYAFPHSYVGGLGRLNPAKIGQQIIVQTTPSGYTFNGDFNYTSINIKIEGTVYATNTSWLVDMDNPLYFNNMSSVATIEIAENGLLQLIDSLGFRNSGNGSTTPPAFDSGRTIFLKGEGLLYSSYNGINVLNRYLFNTDGADNDEIIHIAVYCRVRADFQGIYFCKDKGSFDFYNLLQSGTLGGSGNIALKAFHMTGGQVRFYEKGSISLNNSNTGRLYGITFEPIGLGVGYCIFQLNSARVAGNAQHCFVKLNDEHVNFIAFNSPSGEGFATTLVGTGTITNGLFENLGATRWSVNFKNNVFSYTGIDQTKVDLTGGNSYSTINFIGNSVLENLITKPSRAQAIADGIPLYSAYLKTGGTVYPNTATWVRDVVLPA